MPHLPAPEGFTASSGKLAGQLSIGQVLVLPGQEEAAADTELVIRLLDLAFRPLPQARLKVEFDRESREFTTDGDGKTRIILIHDRSYGVKVHYRERDGQYTLIADHKTLPLGRKLLTMTSRKMALDGVTAPQGRSERISTQEVRDQIKHDHAPLVIQPRADQEGASPAPKPPASKPIWFEVMQKAFRFRVMTRTDSFIQHFLTMRFWRRCYGRRCTFGR